MEIKEKQVKESRNLNEKTDRKGITLIALIITVVIMLILAGVAIATVIDGDGLFSKTAEATEVYENAMKNESDELYELLNKMDITPPDTPTVEWRYKMGLFDNQPFINNIKNIEIERVITPTSYTICTTTSDTPEIEILNINGLKNISKIVIGIVMLSDDINYKIYYTEGSSYNEENFVSGTILKDQNGKEINIPIGNYKKIKIILGDKAGLEYRFGTIDLVADINGISKEFIRNNLKSSDNIGIKKYQYSENKIDWYDCNAQVVYSSNTENCWNKIVYYRAVDWSGNVSEPTDAYVINIDRERPTVTLEKSNINSTSFVLTAHGKDDKSGMYKYEFYIDGILEKTVENFEEEAIYEVNNKLSNTNYKCKVIAYDLVGNNVTSQEIVVNTLK